MVDFRNLPSVDEVLRNPIAKKASHVYGHAPTCDVIRAQIDLMRHAMARSDSKALSRAQAVEQIAHSALTSLSDEAQPAHPPVFNMTGTILHTNLGRAQYAPQAIAAATQAMQGAVALEYDLETGRRGHRDSAIAAQIAKLVGAEAACIVNNNASAVLLALATHSLGRETIVSRGELVEIGGSFRIPSIMEAAGARLREVGTTNRTHLHDFQGAIGAQTGAIMKVHTSNYVIEGFTKHVPAKELADLAKSADVPFIDDLGSGVLHDLSAWGLPAERTVQQALEDGGDLVTFSGDKLLGGPQAGFIVGRKDYVAACNAHPIKRAVRLDKVRLAALSATLQLNADAELVARDLPTMRFLTRTVAELDAMATRLIEQLAPKFGSAVRVSRAECDAQIGSGALPTAKLPSIALQLQARDLSAQSLAAALRALRVPVIGRVANNAVLLDLRCLEDEAGLLAQLGGLVAQLEKQW